MSEVRETLPVMVEILQAIDQHDGSLTEKASQDALLRMLILNKDHGEITMPAMSDLIEKVHANIDSWVLEHCHPSDAVSEFQGSNFADFWALGSRVPYAMSARQSEAAHGTAHERKGSDASSEHTSSGAGGTSTTLKRIGEDLSQPVEKKQRSLIIKVNPPNKKAVEETMEEPTEENQPNSVVESMVPTLDSDLSRTAIPLQTGHPQSEAGAENDQTETPQMDPDGEYVPERTKKQRASSPKLTKKTNTARKTPRKDTRKQGEKWSKESGQLQPPKITPTQRPANPSGMGSRMCDKPYVEKQMNNIQSLLFNAALACCQEMQIDPDSPFKRIARPPNDLKHLFETLWGPEWKDVVRKLRTQKPSVVVLQKHVLMGLFGAGIFLSVFESSSSRSGSGPFPWRPIAASLTSLGIEKYLEAGLADRGYTSNDFLRDLEMKRIADPEFQHDQIVPHASKLANTLLSTLRPQLEALPQGPEIPKNRRKKFQPWSTYLQRAFATSITLKQNLDASSSRRPSGGATFGTYWPKEGPGPLDSASHRPIFELEDNMENAQVVHAILPGVFLVEEDGGGEKKMYFSQALVVPGAAAKEKKKKKKKVK